MRRVVLSFFLARERQLSEADKRTVSRYTRSECLSLREKKKGQMEEGDRLSRWRNHAFIFGTWNFATILWMEPVKERGLPRNPRWKIHLFARKYRLDPAKSIGIKRWKAFKTRKNLKADLFCWFSSFYSRLFTSAVSFSRDLRLTELAFNPRPLLS